MLVPSIFNDNFADDFFNDFFDFPKTRRVAPSRNMATVMQTDVKDLGTGYELGIELPGFKKEEVKAELKDGYLTINAEHTENKDEQDKEGKYIRKERYTGHCSRSFYVGDSVEQDEIKARFENGVLTLTIPKEKEKPAVEEKKMISIEG
ncbi:MAG: Hsp20/alpha crystallin family protein [Lachnospiraceae bacterium]|nr:Hsp20/alpha crystallin family protein [Lachnospiraceae bacterium]